MIESDEEVETGDDAHLIQRTIRQTTESTMRGNEVDLTIDTARNTQTLIPIRDVIIRRKSRVKSTQKAAKNVHLIFINHPMTSENISGSIKEANIIVIDLKLFYQS
jgi:hypothetical protein